MESRLFREYCFKFYLNAAHSVSFNGQKGEIHPHTWEFLIDILIKRENVVQYDKYEKEIDAFFKLYQNRVLNDIEPFDLIVPILENIVDCFGEKIRQRIEEMGGILRKIEGSETPTRSYSISYENDEEYIENIKKYSEESVLEILDKVLDFMIQEGVTHEKGNQDMQHHSAVSACDLSGADSSL